ncbi:hypothetical protein TNIN_175611 [Trichonephila inaurata madagascariensis]|uniref:Uncharacterized protein n=1 Tax=Trichonephila inaurata madagascariensis TaxID=2747483 RepID=A0A8X7C437_9ARAC|nr:hypothetical protein TNIN_175611 [Trichonephila inaurata madagascariensis]
MISRAPNHDAKVSEAPRLVGWKQHLYVPSGKRFAYWHSIIDPHNKKGVWGACFLPKDCSGERWVKKTLTHRTKNSRERAAKTTIKKVVARAENGGFWVSWVCLLGQNAVGVDRGSGAIILERPLRVF